VPKPYILVKGIQVLQDGKIPATEEKIKTKEMRLMEFEKREYFPQHIILSTTSTCLRAKIKDLTSAKDMWEVVKSDATMKSTLYLLNAEEQLANMKLYDDKDSQTHLSEIKHHFYLMLQRRNNLISMGSTISDSRFNTIIMTSLPESYRPTLQTITAAERANLALGKSSKVMKADDLIAFLIEEAQHRIIIEERARVAESALAAHARERSGRGKPKEVSKSESEDTCKNCKRPGHTKFDCWSKGGGKEGQGLKQKKAKAKEKEPAAIADDNDKQMFAFTCTSSVKVQLQDWEKTESGLDPNRSRPEIIRTN